LGKLAVKPITGLSPRPPGARLCPGNRRKAVFLGHRSAPAGEDQREHRAQGSLERTVLYLSYFRDRAAGVGSALIQIRRDWRKSFKRWRPVRTCHQLSTASKAVISRSPLRPCLAVTGTLLRRWFNAQPAKADPRVLWHSQRLLNDPTAPATEATQPKIGMACSPSWLADYRPPTMRASDGPTTAMAPTLRYCFTGEPPGLHRGEIADERGMNRRKTTYRTL